MVEKIIKKIRRGGKCSRGHVSLCHLKQAYPILFTFFLLQLLRYFFHLSLQLGIVFCVVVDANERGRRV